MEQLTYSNEQIRRVITRLCVMFDFNGDCLFKKQPNTIDTIMNVILSISKNSETPFKRHQVADKFYKLLNTMERGEAYLIVFIDGHIEQKLMYAVIGKEYKLFVKLLKEELGLTPRNMFKEVPPTCFIKIKK